MNYTLVEGMLPARLLTGIGIYMQTAAHLELAIWQIVNLVNGIDETSSKAFTDSLETKRRTDKLVRELRACASQCRLGLNLRVTNLANKISSGLAHRNLAAHGAFFVEAGSGSLKVSHFISQGSRPNKEWFSTVESLSLEAIDEAVEEIDLLLREAVSIRESLRGKGRALPT